MLLRLSPQHLLQNELDTFAGHLGGVWDAQAEHVHEARVSTRRIRELLAVLTSTAAGDAKVRDAMRVAGRVLGRVRELDVIEGHLRRIAVAIPALSPVAAAAMTALTASQREERRNMVKGLEDLDIDRVLTRARRLAQNGRRSFLQPTTPWVPAMWERIAGHVDRVRSELKRGTAVYFADRAHSTRISVKKLRYAVEVAIGTGLWNPPHLLKDLRTIQSALGDAHDGQALLDRLPALTDHGAVPGEKISEMKAVLDAEIEKRYGKYLASRERLAIICAVCERQAHGRRWWGKLVA
jgi:CHAD domain-containing protein